MNKQDEIRKKILNKIEPQEREDKERAIELVEIDKIDLQINERHSIENDETIDELVGSIKELGLIQPVVLLKKEDGRYIKISGRRRIEAYKLLKRNKIPAVILNNEDNLSDLDLFKMSFDENIARKNLDAIERANFFLNIIILYFEKEFPEFYETVSKIVKSRANYKEYTEQEKVMAIGREIFKRIYNTERKKNYSDIEIKLLEIWKNLKVKFNINTNTLLKDIQLSTYDEPFLTFYKKKLINYSQIIKQINKIKKYPEAFNFLRNELNNIYIKFENKELNYETAKDQMKEKIDDISKNAKYIELNLQQNEIHKIRDINSTLTGTVKKIQYLIENFEIEEEDLVKIENAIKTVYGEIERIIQEYNKGE